MMQRHSQGAFRCRRCNYQTMATLNHAREFCQHLLNGNYDACRDILRAKPDLIYAMTWDSVSYSGSWGMPLYKRIGFYLRTGGISAYNERCKLFILETVNRYLNDNSEFACGLTMMYALASNEQGSDDWCDVLRDAIQRGKVPFERKASFSLQPRTNAMKAVWASWKKEKTVAECCICMDAPQGAYFSPCGHGDYCFSCIEKLSECPLCRTKGCAQVK